jgi:FAD/FMN-containing dehydrogenase
LLTVDMIDRLRSAVAETGIHAEFGAGARAQFAYDASHYRVPPLGVAYPRSVGDVVALVRVCADLDVPIVPRGGGTSMAGNAIGPGLVIDFSRYMNAVRHIDVAARTAIVEPGIVLDDLQRGLRPPGATRSDHGLCSPSHGSPHRMQRVEDCGFTGHIVFWRRAILSLWCTSL